MTSRLITFVAATVLLAASAAVPTVAKAPFDQIVVFGTSLSDSGNAFALRGGTNTPPDYDVDPLLVPSTPYARGGHHFTNGATWIEQFAQSRGLSRSVRPAFRGSDVNASNFAVGAARAYEDGVNLNLSEQVQTFLARTGGVAPAGALYVVEMGSNDVRDALVAFAGGDPARAGMILQNANLAIAQNIQALYLAGARTFLVWRTPNVGLTPAIRTLDRLNPGAAQLATGLTQAFNGGLDLVVAQLSQGLPGLTIARLNAFALLNGLVADPVSFGLSNVTTACLTPAVAPFACQQPDEFLFWDGIHPSRAVHAITAQEAARVLGQ